MTRTRWLSLCAVGLVLGVSACVPTRGAAAAEPAAATRHEIPITKAALRGPKDAPVTIIEFSDFQCPYCAQATALVDQVLKAYPERVNFVYKNFPLPMHANADPAARAAIAAGKQGKFWEMHDELFRHAGDLSAPTLHALAEKLGLNVAAFDADMRSVSVKEQLDVEIRQGKVAGVRGTPTFFVNGRMAPVLSFQGLQAMIEDELQKKTSS